MMDAHLQHVDEYRIDVSKQQGCASTSLSRDIVAQRIVDLAQDLAFPQLVGAQSG